MKVKDFIKALQTAPQDFEVIMAKDGEGNSFSPFCEFSDEVYEATTTWYGEIVTPEGACIDPGVYNAIVLWPIN